ncbi:MAG: hypothetical protein AB7G39_16750 [Alphaproteobacteria bacterium]
MSRLEAAQQRLEAAVARLDAAVARRLDGMQAENESELARLREALQAVAAERDDLDRSARHVAERLDGTIRRLQTLLAEDADRR